MSREERENRIQELLVEQLVHTYMWPCWAVYNAVTAISMAAVLFSSTRGTDCHLGSMNLSTWLLVKLLWVLLHDLALSWWFHRMTLVRIRRGESPSRLEQRRTRLETWLSPLVDCTWWIVGWIWYAYTHVSCTEVGVVKMVLAMQIMDLVMNCIAWCCCVPLMVIVFAYAMQHRDQSETPALTTDEAFAKVAVTMLYIGDGHVNPRSLVAMKSSECAVCAEEYVQNETDLAQLQCGHAFHEGCIKQWFAVKGNCPTCRAIPAPVPGTSNAMHSVV
jgi:hypothetical protein